jgi:superfamily II DNA or RNA helicase
MKIQIEFRPNFCTIVTPLSPEINEDLYNKLSFHPNGYFFAPKYQAYVQAKAANLAAIQRGNPPIYNLTTFNPNFWDGYIHLYKSGRQQFKTGLLYRIIEILKKEHNLDSDVVDFPISGVLIQRNNTYTPRPYQRKVAEDIIKRRFGIVQAPPRSGKTLISALVIDSEYKFPVIMFCRSIDLARQTCNVYSSLLPTIKVGMTGDGQTDIQDINVMTVQSVYAAYNKKYTEKVELIEKPIENKIAIKQLLSSAKIVFMDECHHASSTSSEFVLDKCINAEMKIGLSATPYDDSENELQIENVLGRVISQVTYSQLIEEKFILRPHIYMYKLPKDNTDAPYQTIYKQCVVDNEFLNGLIKKLYNKIVSMGESVVIQTEQINHTKKLAKLLGCDYITGKEKGTYREEMINSLREGKIKALVSTLFEEGIDVPSLSYTINVAGNLSNISVFQRMRSITVDEKSNKEFCGVIDFFHQCKYLQRHSKRRKKLYKSEPAFVYIERDVSKKRLEDIN